MIRMEEGKGEIAREEVLIAKAEEAIEDLFELIEMDFLEVGDRYGFEQILPDPLSWGELNEVEKQVILKAAGSRLGVDLIEVPEEQVIRRYKEEGVAGQPSEGGAEVTVLKTREPQLTIHILKYENPDIGTRYDFVRES